MGTTSVERGLTFTDGYRNGHSDAMLGLRSIIAVTSPHVRYAEGYRYGQKEAIDEREAARHEAAI